MTAPTPQAHRPGAAVSDQERSRRRERIIAFALLVLVGMPTAIGGSAHLSEIVALLALPATWSEVRRSRVLGLLLIGSVLAAVTGLTMSIAAPNDFTVIGSIRRATVVSVLSVPCSATAFAWGARRLGLDGAALAVGLGLLLNSLSLLGSVSNPWKFGIGLSTSIVVLAIVSRLGHIIQVIALAVLGALFLLQDSRAALGFIGVTAFMVVWHATIQRIIPAIHFPRRRAAFQAVAMSVAVLAMAVGVLGASAAGALGADAQARTLAQSTGSTNILLAARPELAASWALFVNRPWGYGAGIAPRHQDVRAAMDGMAAVGYDPNNGYVLNFMFGHGFELHSGLVDMWVACSLPGAVLVASILVLSVVALLRDLGSPQIHPWLFLAVLVAVMNILVGPWSVLPPFLTLVLGTVLVQVPLRRTRRRFLRDVRRSRRYQR